MGPRKYNIDDCKRMAKGHNGECLSSIYNSSNEKLNWCCANGHKFTATFSNVKNGQWCQTCSPRYKRIGIDKVRNFIENKGGKLLSTEYKNSISRILVQCENGHEPWLITTSNLIHKNKWCPTCSGNRRYTIEKVKKFVEEKRNGKCLSDIYVNSSHKLIWQCELGHQWDGTWNSVQQGQWCPICNGSAGENICQLYFSSIFGGEFVKIRPDWLINDRTGRKLELDGLNIIEKIAFEHNGCSHYVVDGNFNKTEKDLEKVQYNDRLKIKLCKENNIRLIVVPQVFIKVSLLDLKGFIYQECLKNDIDVSKYFWNKEVDISGLNYENKIASAEFRKKYDEKYLEKLGWTEQYYGKI